MNNHIKSDSVQGLPSVVVVGISFQNVLEDNALNLCYWNELSCAQPCLSGSNYVSKFPCKELHASRRFLTREIQNFDRKKPLVEAWGFVCVDTVWESSADLCCNEKKKKKIYRSKEKKKSNQLNPPCSKSSVVMLQCKKSGGQLKMRA